MTRLTQSNVFAPGDALLREAIVSSSPYYRFLCGFKLYEFVRETRAVVARLCRRYDLDVSPPKQVRLKPDDLTDIIGLLKGTPATSQQLFERLSKLRDRAAHFLLTREREVLPIWEGKAFRAYSLASAILVRVAERELRELEVFFDRHLLDRHRPSYIPDVKS